MRETKQRGKVWQLRSGYTPESLASKEPNLLGEPPFDPGFQKEPEPFVVQSLRPSLGEQSSDVRQSFPNGVLRLYES
jgi:hypothetical protein